MVFIRYPLFSEKSFLFENKKDRQKRNGETTKKGVVRKGKRKL